jgi:Zn-dependent protease
VAIAGVTVNFILAFLFFGVYYCFNIAMFRSGLSNIQLYHALSPIILNVIWMNLALMIFNLLPVPPLDGFNIVTEIFDLRRYRFWYTLYNAGFAILMVLIMLGVTGRVMSPALSAVADFMDSVWRFLLQALL